MLLRRRKNNTFIKPAIFIVVYILFLGLLGLLFSSVFWVKKPLFISPVTINGEKYRERIKEKLVNARIAFSNISLDADSSYVVRLTDGEKVILSSKKDIEKQISSLQSILKQLTIEGRKFNRIDFRFDKPIVVF